MSYMSQPCTNSEAVKRCMNIPIQPMSSQVARPIPPQRPLNPKPPYSYDSSKPARPFSGNCLVYYIFIVAFSPEANFVPYLHVIRIKIKNKIFKTFNLTV